IDAASRITLRYLFFSFPAPSTSELYTLSLHDALPISVKTPGLLISIALYVALISPRLDSMNRYSRPRIASGGNRCGFEAAFPIRSEEHTSELQSRFDLVCRLLLEKKKITLRKNQNNIS